MDQGHYLWGCQAPVMNTIRGVLLPQTDEEKASYSRISGNEQKAKEIYELDILQRQPRKVAEFIRLEHQAREIFRQKWEEVERVAAGVEV